MELTAGPIEPDQSNHFFEEVFSSHCVVAVLRALGPKRTLEVLNAVWDSGIELAEVTIETEDGMASLRVAASAATERQKLVGAGTVTTKDQVSLAKDLGAAFTVAPGLDRQVVDASLAEGLPHLPGVATPTEIQAALSLGLSWLKAFPASLLTPAWIRAMAGPFPQVRFVVTGGLSAETAAKFLDAGAAGVGLGSIASHPEEIALLAKLEADRRASADSTRRGA